MLTPDERPFIAQILADPEAEAPRLVYTDWLEERKDVRAEAVRVGAERKVRQRALMGMGEKDLRLAELDRRQNNLNIDFRRKLGEHLPKVKGVQWGKLDGGVIEDVTVTDPRSFAKRAEDILSVQPVYQFLGDWNDQTLPLAFAAPAMARLGGMMLGGNYQGPVLATALAGAPHIDRLRMLNISFGEIQDAGARRLAKAAHLAGLKDLTLYRNQIRSGGFKALCQSPHLAGVERLMLGWNSLGARAAEVLAGSTFTNLRWLDLSDTKLKPEGLVTLARSGRIGQLQWLNLGWTGIDAASLEAVLNAAGSRLVRLNLLGNKLDAAAACAALAQHALPELRELNVELHGEVDAATARKFADAPWLRKLEKLKLLCRDWQSLGSRLAEARWDGLVQLHLIHLRGKNDDPSAPDRMIAALTANSSRARLRLLELHLPLSSESIGQLATMKGLQSLAIPQTLREDMLRLKAELPACDVGFTSYSS